MDEYIDQMVAEDIEPIEIVIQGKSETGHRPIRYSGAVAIRKEGSLKAFPCYFFKVQIGIIRDVWLIVKMPRAVKRISVY